MLWWEAGGPYPWSESRKVWGHVQWILISFNPLSIKINLQYNWFLSVYSLCNYKLYWTDAEFVRVTDKSKGSWSTIASTPVTGAASRVVTTTRTCRKTKMLTTRPASSPPTARFRCLYSAVAPTEIAAVNTSEQTRTWHDICCCRWLRLSLLHSINLIAISEHQKSMTRLFSPLWFRFIYSPKKCALSHKCKAQCINQWTHAGIFDLWDAE